MITELVPPVVGSIPGWLTVLVCWPVMIGTDCDTLMTAFLFSDVMMCGFETMLTRLSEASVFRSAKNFWLSNVKAVRPAPIGPKNEPMPASAARGRLMFWLALPDDPVAPAEVGRPEAPNAVLAVAFAIENLPVFSAQSMPRRVS